MKETRCKSCEHHLGTIILGDVFCDVCESYNIIRPLKKTKIISKILYKPSSDLKYCANTTYPVMQT